jgi:hypothetical protein
VNLTDLMSDGWRRTVRLIRLGQQSTEVGADLHAALASWGHGQSVMGGLALTGCQPPSCPRPADAVMLLPRGFLVVVGVDLPDPAMRLDAPLAGQWKIDGWPLVRRDGAVNPAIDALQVSDALAQRLGEAGVEPLPVGTVVAVGPYASQVVQPTSDLLRGVRILHPEPTTLLTAARELAVYQGRCSVDGAQAILAVFRQAVLAAVTPVLLGVDAAIHGVHDREPPDPRRVNAQPAGCPVSVRPVALAADRCGDPGGAATDHRNRVRHHLSGQPVVVPAEPQPGRRGGEPASGGWSSVPAQGGQPGC